jgi:uncharacterized Ntn-hydrolase superfamily protein
LCPFADEHGALATQALLDVHLRRKGVTYLAEGLAVEDALEAILEADEGSPEPDPRRRRRRGVCLLRQRGQRPR